MCKRRTEDGQQPVTGELVDGALERMDRIGRDRQKAVEEDAVTLVESTMSVYMTVTCLRSPSISVRSERIFASSARGARSGLAFGVSAAPHCSQNRARAVARCPQSAHCLVPMISPAAQP
jgi:hypothetical protein